MARADEEDVVEEFSAPSPGVTEIELIHEKVDALITETRGSRMQRERMERKLDETSRKTSANGEKIDRLAIQIRAFEKLPAQMEVLINEQTKTQTGMLEILAIARRSEVASGQAVKVAKDAKQVAVQAHKEASNPRESWTDEFAKDAAAQGLALVKKREDEELAERSKRKAMWRKIAIGGAAVLWTTVVPTAIALLVHGCAK